jgi:hypothetical protein
MESFYRRVEFSRQIPKMIQENVGRKGISHKTSDMDTSRDTPSFMQYYDTAMCIVVFECLVEMTGR